MRYGNPKIPYHITFTYLYYSIIHVYLQLQIQSKVMNALETELKKLP